MIKSAQTPELESTPDPLGLNGLWQTPGRKVPEKQHLPFYVQHIADALQRSGMGESQAIATAISAIRSWAAGTAFGGKVPVTAEVQQAARRAMDEWEALRRSHE